MWMQLKQFLIKANSNEPLTKDDERHFLQIKSDLAKCQRSLSGKLKDNYTTGFDQIQNLLRQTISVSHMRNIPPTDRRSLFKDWHGVYITLTSLTGAIEYTQQTGHLPVANKKGGGQSIAGIKSRSGKAKKARREGGIPLFAIVCGVSFLVGVGYFLIMGPN
jgi:hypothetical protein